MDAIRNLLQRQPRPTNSDRPRADEGRTENTRRQNVVHSNGKNVLRKKVRPSHVQDIPLHDLNQEQQTEHTRRSSLRLSQRSFLPHFSSGSASLFGLRRREQPEQDALQGSVQSATPSFRVIRNFAASTVATSEEEHADRRVVAPRVENGRFEMGSIAGKYLEQRINRLHKHFGGGVANLNGGFRFHDEQNRSFYVHQNHYMAGALRASRLPVQEGRPSASPEAPGLELMSVSSGIHHNRVTQESFRLQGTQLCHYSPSHKQWELSGPDHHYTRIARQANGRVYGVRDSQRDIAVSATGYRYELSENAPNRIMVSALDGMDDDFAEGLTPELRLNLVTQGQGAPFTARRIALGADNTLYALNDEGELFAARLPRVPNSGPMNRLGSIREEAGEDQVVEKAVSLQKVSSLSTHLRSIGFSSSDKVEGFLHDDNGGINLILVDRYNQKHSVHIDPSRNHYISPGWNLSDGITLFDKSGAPGINNDVSGSVIRLQQRQQGQLAIHDGHLFVRSSEDTDEWRRSGLDNISQVEQSYDDKIYALKNGDIIQLELSTKSPSVPVDEPLMLRAPHVETQVKEGDKLAEGGTTSFNGIRAFTLLDDKHLITLNSAGDMVAHVDGRPVTLPIPLGSQRVRQLKLDEHKALHVVTDEGAVYRMSGAEWQRLAPSVHNWERLELPGNLAAEQLQFDSHHQLVAVSGEQNFILGQDGVSRTPQDNSRQASTLQADDFHQRSQNEYDPYGPVTRRGNWAGETSHNVLGVMGEGNLSKAPTISAIKRWGSKIASHTHVINGMGDAVRAVGQRINGRAGLENVYQEEKALHQTLKELSQATNQPAFANLTVKLDALSADNDVDGRSDLIQGIRIASSKLAERNFHAALQLGDIHNALDQTWSQPSLQKAGKYFADHLAPGLQREQASKPNMVEDLLAIIQRAPVSSEDQRAVDVLNTLVHTNGLNLPYPRESERRGRGDESALLRASLIQNTHLLHRLHELTDRLERVPQGSPDNKIPVLELKQRFDQLIEAFESSELQTYAAAQFTEYRSLEKVYSAHKNLNHQLSTPKSALGRHIREQLSIQEQSPEALARELSQHVGSMRGGDATKLSKSAETNVVAPYVLVPGTPLLVTGSVGFGQSSELKVERDSSGAGNNFSLSRKKLSTVYGEGLLPAIPGFSQEGTITSPDTTSENVGSGLVVVAELSGSYNHSKKDAMKMSLSDAGTSKLFSNLAQRNARLIDLINIGREHKVQSDVTHMAKLDLGGFAEIRANVGQSDEDPVNAWFRAGLGVAGEIGLFEWEAESSIQRGGSGHAEVSRSSHLHGLPGASATAFLRAPQFVMAGGSVVQRTPFEISSSIKVEQSKSTTFATSFKAPDKVENKDVDKLITALKKEFPDDKANIEGRLNEHLSVIERLQALMQWKIDKGTAWQSTTNEQHAALYSLGSLYRRQNAVDNNRRQFMSASRVVALPSLGKLPQLSDGPSSDSSGASTNAVLPKGALSRMLHKKESSEPKIKWLEGCSTENQNYILRMLRTQPHFAELIRMMEEKHTGVEVSLELKESVRQDIEERMLRVGSESERPLSSKDIQAILNDPNNIRIQRVRVLHDVAPSSSVKTPPLGLQLKSSATFSHGQQKGIIEFEYGMNEDHPIAFKYGEGAARAESNNPVRKQLEGNNVQIQ